MTKQQRAERLRTVLVDGLFIAANASMVYGTWLIYHPAAFIVGAVLAIFYVFLYARGQQKQQAALDQTLTGAP